MSNSAFSLPYLSPTSIGLFESNREQFFLTYLADNKLPREPQTEPMAIGSAVDAYIKSYLYERLFGAGHDPAFELNNIFEAQVEPQHRDWAIDEGRFIFEVYKSSGALAEFALELDRSAKDPKFEFKIESRVPHSDLVDGIPLLGKPDVYYWIDGILVIRDWKVNGWCAKNPTSPKKGYIKVYPGGRAHKDAIVAVKNNMTINLNHNLNDIDEGWARQIAIYGWVLDQPPGSDFVASIEQFACQGRMNEPKIALYRSTVCPHFQQALHDKVAHIWKCIQSGHIFDDLDSEQNDNKIERLNKLHSDANEAWLHKVCQTPSWGY